MDEMLKSRVVSLILQTFPEVIAVYRFGSFGTPAATPESDVDLAFLLPPAYNKNPPAVQLLWTCSNHLSAALQIIPDSLGNFLKAMVGFGNLAVHDYQRLDLEIVRKIIQDKLSEMLHFCAELLKSS